MAEETTSVRITQKDIYEKLLELQAIQIEIVADIKKPKRPTCQDEPRRAETSSLRVD